MFLLYLSSLLVLFLPRQRASCSHRSVTPGPRQGLSVWRGQWAGHERKHGGISGRKENRWACVYISEQSLPFGVTAEQRPGGSHCPKSTCSGCAASTPGLLGVAGPGVQDHLLALTLHCAHTTQMMLSPPLAAAGTVTAGNLTTVLLCFPFKLAAWPAALGASHTSGGMSMWSRQM